MKRKLTTIFICIALLFTSSCTTKLLWGYAHYEEDITRFLVGADGRYVALIGNKYHYVFADNSQALKEVLALNQKGVLHINYNETSFHLDANNNVEGTIVIQGPFSILSPHDKTVLLSLGYQPDRDDEIIIKIDLHGKRYLSKYLGHNTNQPTNYHYAVRVYYRKKSSLIKSAGKVAVTPIAITIDATLLIGKVLLSPLSLGG